MEAAFKYFSVNRNGCSIRCKQYSNGNEAISRVVIAGHGFSGHKDNRAAERFADRILSKNKGIAVITFDWPCHGDDVRKALRLEDCDNYLHSVIDYVNDTFDSPELYAYATSFGGYLFLKYIFEHGDPFKAAAFRCPAVSMYDVMMKTIMSEDDTARLRKGKAISVGFDRKVMIDRTFIDQIREADIQAHDFTPYSNDILIIQGTDDELVDPDSVRSFAEKNSIAFEPVDGADHRFMDPLKMLYAIELIAIFFDMK